MKTPIAVALFTSLSAFASGAAADEPSSPMPTLPASAPAAAAPAAPSASCHIGEHGGVDDADAQTATQLVCAELSRAGAPAGATYRVDIGRLGSLVVLTVAREGSLPGSTADARQLKLHGIEDVTSAAPRLAAALVNGTALDEAEVVSQTVAGDKRNPPISASKIHFALGLIGQFPPFDRSATPAPGIDFELHSELDPFEIVGNFRFGADSDDRSVGVVFVNFAMGGRYFPGDGDTSPYLGGGFAWSYLSVNDNVNNDFSGSHAGLGAYGEAGVEFLRQRHTHLAIGARLDAPFFSVTNDRSGQTISGGAGTIAPQPVVPPSIYYAPLSLELRLTF
jgi:hypothetical protein